MSNTIIFTEIINCGPVGRIMLESFHKYHDRKITIYARPNDIEELGEIKNHPNNLIYIIPITQANKFEKGHEGTASVFATMFCHTWHPEDAGVIHVDSDVVFKKESICLIENAFEEGYDIVGSRRCYKNNPGKVPVPDGIPDAVSTYFFGMKTKVLPKGYNFEEMAAMIAGNPGPLSHMIMDFFDPITFLALQNGAKIKFLESDIIGGQDSIGSKVNNYKSNLHLDMGSHLSHWGGVGSGYAVEHGLSQPEQSYAKWSRGRWNLFSRLFYGVDTGFNEPTQYNNDGRWVSGAPDFDIMNIVLQDLEN